METVSVIIPAYNQEEFVGEAVESALGQSYPHIQIIVVDDGSTDGTKDVLERYKDSIEVIHQANAGVSAARNAGIRKAAGQYLCFLDSDDLFLPTKVERQLAAFRHRADIGLVHTGATVTRRKNSGWAVWYTYVPPVYQSRDAQIAALLKSNFIFCSSVMVKRDLFSQAGLFNENYKYGEDYDMWLRLLACCNFASIPELLIEYRWHNRNMSRSPDVSALTLILKEAARRLGRT